MAEDIRILVRAAAEGLGQITDAAKRIKDLGGDSSEAEAAARKLKEQLDQLAAQQRLITTFQQTKREIGDTEVALAKAQQNAQTLGREFSKTEQPTAKLKREFEGARKEVTQLRDRLIAQNGTLNESRSALQNAGINTKELASAQVQIRQRTGEAQQGLKGYSEQLDRTEKELRETANQAKPAANDIRETGKAGDEATGGLGRFRSVLLGVGAALGVGGIGTVLRNSSVQAAEFGNKVAEVSTLLSDTSGVDGLADSARRLAIEFGNTPTEQAQAFYNVISAGTTDAAEATQLLTQANKLAVGGVTDVATAADGITSVLNAYGLSAENAEQVSDQLFTTVRLGKTTVDEYSRAIGQLAPIAAQVGVGFDEVSAAVASLTANGVQTSQAITQVRAAIANVLKPTADAEKLADKLGIQFDAVGLKSKGLGGFLRDVTTATGGNIESLTRLFGSTEAVQAVLGLTGDQLERFDTNLKQVRESAGATDEAFGKIATGDQATAARMRAVFNDLALTAGELINRALIPLGTELATLSGGLGKTGDEARELGDDVEAASSRIAPLLSVMAGALQVFGTGVQTAFNGVQIVVGGLVANVLEAVGLIVEGLAKVSFGGLSRRLSDEAENIRQTVAGIRAGIATDFEDIARAGERGGAGLAKMGEGLAALGRGAEAAAPKVAETADATEKLEAQAGLTADEVLALGEGAEVAAGQIVQTARAADDATTSLADTEEQTTALTDAYKALGIQSSAALKLQAAEAQAAYEAIRRSGVASAGDIERAEIAAQQATDRYADSLKTKAQIEREASLAAARTAAADRDAAGAADTRRGATDRLTQALDQQIGREETLQSYRAGEDERRANSVNLVAGGNANQRTGFNLLSATDQQLIAELEALRLRDQNTAASDRSRGVSTSGPGSALQSQTEIAAINNELNTLLRQLTQGGAAAEIARQTLRGQLGLGPGSPDPATAAVNQQNRNVQTIRIELPRVGNFSGAAITTTDANSASNLQAFIEQLLRDQSLTGAGA